MKKIIGFVCILLTYSGMGQSYLSEDDLWNLVLQNSPALKVAELNTRKNIELEKSAYNFSNPEFLMESPTGEFQTLGVIQSFNFPTVYVNQNKLLKKQSALSRTGEKATLAEVKFRFKILYLDFQYASALVKFYKSQDSLYELTKNAAFRQFEAGQIDYLQKTFAETRYSEINNKYNEAKSDEATLLNQLQLLTGLSTAIAISGIQKISGFKNPLLLGDSLQSTMNLTLLYAKDVQQINRQNISLEKSKFLPGITVGYLNQGAKGTPSDLRIRAGLSLPLWFWQYTSQIQSAKTALKVSEQQYQEEKQSIDIQLIKAKGEFKTSLQSLNYYENRGLKQAAEIVATSSRFFENGREDFITHLRYLSDANDIHLRYIDTLKKYNQSILTIQYLTGSL